MSSAAARIRRAGWQQDPEGASATECGAVQTVDGRPLTVRGYTATPAVPDSAQVEVGAALLDLGAARELAAVLTAVVAVAEGEPGRP